MMGLRPYILGCGLLIGLLSGCDSGSPDQHFSEQEAIAGECSGLDSLVLQIKAFSQTLQSQNPATDRIESQFVGIVDGLQANQGADSACSYLDESHQPEHLRFDFVDHLTQWAIRDTASQSVRYLIKLRGIFIDDSAISEFFSEEIARIALRNPWAYQRYFVAHPRQQQLLLNSTRWSHPDLNVLIYNFEELAPEPTLREYLTDMRIKLDMQAKPARP